MLCIAHIGAIFAIADAHSVTFLRCKDLEVYVPVSTTAAAVNEVSAPSALAIGTASAAVMDLGTSDSARAATCKSSHPPS